MAMTWGIWDTQPGLPMTIELVMLFLSLIVLSSKIPKMRKLCGICRGLPVRKCRLVLLILILLIRRCCWHNDDLRTRTIPTSSLDASPNKEYEVCDAVMRR